MKKFKIFNIQNISMKKLSALAISLFFLKTAYAFNETEAIERPVTFVMSLKDGILAFLGSTIGWFAVLILAVGFAGVIIGIGKTIRDW